MIVVEMKYSQIVLSLTFSSNDELLNPEMRVKQPEDIMFERFDEEYI